MQGRRTVRASAAAVAASLGVVGAVVLSAPAAHAAEVDYTSACKNDFLGPVGETATKIDISVSPVKATYSVGDTVTVTWKWLAYNNVPANSPMTTIPANSTTPYGDIIVSGAQTDAVALEGPAQHPAADAGTPLKVADMIGTLRLTSPGTVTLAPKGYKTVTDVGIAKSTTLCDPAAGQVPGIAATLAVEGQQSTEPVLDGPSDSMPGLTIDLTGHDFAPNATPQVSLCAADGSACDAAKIAGNTLVIDGQGKLSGKATIAGLGIPTGSYAVRVSDGTKSATHVMTITKFVPSGPHTAIGNVTSGPIGTVVHVTGENWDANAEIAVLALDSDDFWLAPVVSVKATPDGKFAADFTIDNEWVRKIQVMQGGNEDTAVRFPFTITGSAVQQNASVTLAPGALSMAQAGDGLDFGTVTLNGEAQTVKANLNQVTVLDARGGNLGWSLTGSMTDLVAANGTDKIPAGNLAWTPSCAAGAGSLSTVASGTAGALGQTPSTLCSVTADGKTSGGNFTAEAEVSLTTPKFGAAGSYTGTLTLTLI
ncbi:hypothetical protein GCM10023205_59810 [Yinghuangia aomiensis]|uniref:WxL domain surface cell wall-binding n=1 Tax=Yinghuangia aomiensis TaxID=676205 RepID=A0ABP9HZ85_9ACTN